MAASENNHKRSSQPAGVLGSDHSTATITVNAVFLSVAWIAVVLRTYTRIRLVKAFLSEDWTMLVTILFFTVYCTAVIIQSKIIDVGADNLLDEPRIIHATELLLISESMYSWTVLALKISVGLFFLRLTIIQWHRVVIWTTMFLSTATSLALFLFFLFECGYFFSIYDFVGKRVTGQCASSYTIAAMTYTHAAVTSFTDWVFVLIPFLILQKTLMQRREKISIGALMALASVGCVASLIRFKSIPGIAVTGPTFFSSVANIAIWSCAEPGIGIVAGCIVCLRPLARAAFGSMVKDYRLRRGSRRRQDHQQTDVESLSRLRGTSVVGKQDSANNSGTYELREIAE